MKSPYEVLGISPQADEATVRQGYLGMVQKHRPDQDPAKFVEIRAAYDELRDPIKRLENSIFMREGFDSLNDIVHDVHVRLRGTRIPVATLLSLGET